MGKINFGNAKPDQTIKVAATKPVVVEIPVERAVIAEVEKIVEVPVTTEVIKEIEVIREVEKIVEVPVIKEVIKEIEKIIEIPVIKIQERLIEDTEKIDQLKSDLNSTWLINVDLSSKNHNLQLKVKKLKHKIIGLSIALAIVGVLYVSNI